MEQNLVCRLVLVKKTPAALDALLRGLKEIWTERNEGENTWTVRSVMTHLIHTEEENWIPRARMILEFGEAREFAPLDREGSARNSQGKTLEYLLDEFARARAKGLDDLRAMNV